MFFKLITSPINDITTSLDAAPKFRAVIAGKPPEYPGGAVKLRQQELYPQLKALNTSAKAIDLFQRVKTLAGQQAQWKIMFENPELYHLEVEARTSLIGFVDDVILEVRVESQGGSSLHMRSRSRVGRNDFGANYKRIREFLSLVEKSTL